MPGHGHLEQVGQERVQMGSECLHAGTLHALPGQPIPGILHVKFLLMSRWNLRLIYGHCSLSCVCAHREESTSLPLAAGFAIFKHYLSYLRSALSPPHGSRGAARPGPALRRRCPRSAPALHRAPRPPGGARPRPRPPRAHPPHGHGGHGTRHGQRLPQTHRGTDGRTDGQTAAQTQSSPTSPPHRHRAQRNRTQLSGTAQGSATEHRGTGSSSSRGTSIARCREPRPAALPGGRSFLSALAAKLRGGSAGCGRGGLGCGSGAPCRCPLAGLRPGPVARFVIVVIIIVVPDAVPRPSGLGRGAAGLGRADGSADRSCREPWGASGPSLGPLKSSVPGEPLLPLAAPLSAPLLSSRCRCRGCWWSLPGASCKWRAGILKSSRVTAIMAISWTTTNGWAPFRSTIKTSTGTNSGM